MSLDYKLETKSLARQIADNIREAIVNGELQADDRLPTEPELAERYGVSRPTIREALKRLTAQKLIRSRRGPSGGTFIRRMAPGDLAEGLSTHYMLMVGMGEISLDQVAEARAGLELLCGQLACAHITEEQISTLETIILAQANRHTSDEGFCASDVRFHKTLAAATGNPVLETTMAALLDALQPATNMIIYRLRDRDTVVAQHQAIVKGLKEKNEQAVSQAIEEQMGSLRDLYRQAQAEKAANKHG